MQTKNIHKPLIIKILNLNLSPLLGRDLTQVAGKF